MKTKDLLIQTTAELIHTKGYYGTGLNEVLKEVGVPKGSLYHHFPKGKDELVAEALKFAAEQNREIFKNATKGQPSAIAGLEAIVEVFVVRLVESNYDNACPLATVSLDISSGNELLRNVCQNMFQFWIDALESYLVYKGQENAKRQAEEFMMRLEGALLLSKIYQSTKFLQMLKSDVKNILNT